MLVERVRLHQAKGSVGFAEKRDTPKELAQHQSRYVIDV
jgi:hypothetical protein